MNTKIEALKKISEGIAMLIALEESTSGGSPSKVEKNEVATEVRETTPISKGNITVEQLDGMTYNDIKKLAKELGVSASGSRPEIVARILGTEVETETEEVDLSDAPDEEPTGDEIADKVRALAEDMSIEDIADVLASVDISAKGKREALIEKLIQAVKDGKIELDDEDAVEEETESIEEDATEEAEEVTEEADEEVDEDVDDTNDFNNPNMTKERKKAIEVFTASMREQIKSGELDVASMKEFVTEYYDIGVNDLDVYSNEDIADFYIDIAVRFIDDGGDIVEEEAYMLNGEPACCGKPLAYNEKTNQYECSSCGGKYSVED